MIPHEAKLSHAAIDLIKKLINDPNERLGINGVEEIKIHPFFQGVDWKNIRNKKAAIMPEINGDLCHKNFDPYDEEEPWYTPQLLPGQKKPKNKNDYNFIGYTYKRDNDSERTPMVIALENLEKCRPSNFKNSNQNNNNKSSINLHTHMDEPPYTPNSNPYVS